MNIDEIKERIQEDLRIDTSDLSEEVRNQPAVHHRYISLLQTEQHKLAKIKRAMNTLHSLLFESFRWNGNIRRRTTAELESAITSNTKFQEIAEKFDAQTNYVTYLEHVLDLFKSRGFALKNLVDLEKMENMV